MGIKKQLVTEPVFTETKEEVLEAEKIYRHDQYLSFHCKNCGKISQKKIVGFQVQNYQFYCTHCQKAINAEKTFREKYGVKNIGMLKETQEKMRQTRLDRHGDPTYNNRQKAKETTQDKYGVDNVSQSQKIKNKKSQTFLKHFGETNVFKTEYFDEKRKQTSLERYGTEFPSQSQSVKDKQEQTNLQRWGYKSTAQHPEVRKKSSKNIKRACDNRTPEQWSEIRKKACRKYMYKGCTYDSSWEVALRIYADDHNEELIREPCSFEYYHEGKKHRYFPDFKYRGELLELKGGHFFNEQGVLCNPYDSSQDSLFAAKDKLIKQLNIPMWSSQEMKPILGYVYQNYSKDFIELFNTYQVFPYPKLTSNGDYQIIKYFHKSIYEATCKGCLSPLQAWQDKDLVYKAALNRLKYIKSCKPSDILRGFSLTKIAPKVSVFKPSLAERLIQTYLSSSKTIFDPFSGFSGRMLGTINCNKTYIGQDIHLKHVQESNEIIQYKNLQNCTVVIQDLLTDQNKTFQNTSLFTCPPYGGKEHWNENNDEIEKSCDEWIDICLSKYKCDKYLFVVDQTEKYKDRVVEKLHKKTIWGGKPELVILIQ